MEWISKLIEAAKLPTRFILCIFLVSFALLCLPQSLIVSLHLKEFIEKYAIYVGITILTSGALLIVELFIYSWNAARKKIGLRKIRKSAVERIQNLDPAGKGVLREFYLQRQNTIKLPMDHPVVARLLSDEILNLVGGQGRRSMAGLLFSMKISDFIRRQLTYDLLELPTNEPTQREMEFLRDNQPSFMSSIEREDSLLTW